MQRRFRHDIIVLAVCLFLTETAHSQPRWGFQSEVDLEQWVPNAHLSAVHVDQGVLKARAIGADPFFLCRQMQVEATPWQCVVLRVKASSPGIGELFWSGQLEGKYSGLTEAKKVRFAVKNNADWQEIVLFPFWHTEGTIRQLRLDLYGGADFAIDWIDIRDWDRNRPQSSVCAWDMGDDASDWQIHPDAPERFAPPVVIDVSDKTWVSVELASDREGTAAILWAGEKQPGLQSEEFTLAGDGATHIYDIHMAGLPTWQGSIVAFGIRLPAERNVRLGQVRIGSEALGPGRLEVSYFGFENGVNRAGRPCKLLAQIANRGGRARGLRSIRLIASPGLTIASEPQTLSHEGIEYGDFASFVWEIEADKPGTYPVRLTFSGKGAIPSDATAMLTFSELPEFTEGTYVPRPHPVETSVEVCAFYFPGWDSEGKWNCIRRIAPIRKPLLGYYDESNPECVDWQIKWAVENGISCFLVDWYWVQGSQHLTHWFDAYRRAKYRDLLKVAIMWANHNPPGTHSADDWLKVTQHWIDHYFALPGYYHIDGKPAVFIWDPKAIRTDLGGTPAVQRVFDQAQKMVHAVGFDGMTLIALGNDFSDSHLRALEQEGYTGVTTYHEWGNAIDGGVTQKRFRYEDVVHTSPDAWQRKQDASGDLAYYPLVDTGWDSRPWHGNKAMAIEGRTPFLFERLLQEVRVFCRENNQTIVILGPVNEWGEGSYIEPCTEFGFAMIEAIRQTFAKGAASSWPINLTPRDVGLGPYDFPPHTTITTWTFDNHPDGWQPMMNVGQFRCEDGALRFRTVSPDPALVTSLSDVRASSFSKLCIRMQLLGDVPKHATGQFFWSQGGAAITEAGSARFALDTSRSMHTYEIDLAAHPRWFGRISALRFDPCSSSDIDVVIDEVRLLP